MAWTGSTDMPRTPRRQAPQHTPRSKHKDSHDVRGAARVMMKFSAGLSRSDTLPVSGVDPLPAGPLPQGFSRGDFWYDYAIPME